MKNNITISLDSEIVSNLKEENNYSDLINREMKAYYEGVESNNIKKLKQKQAQSKKIIKESRKELKIINQLIKKTESEEIRILKFMKKYPKYIVKVAKSSRTQAILWINYQRDEKMREICWDEMKQLFKDLKGGGE